MHWRAQRRYAVTVHCIERGSVAAINVRRFDGTDWEGTVKESGIEALSKHPIAVPSAFDIDGAP